MTSACNILLLRSGKSLLYYFFSRRFTVVLPVVPSLPVHDACMDISARLRGKILGSELCNLVMVSPRISRGCRVRPMLNAGKHMPNVSAWEW